jgi:hypothetical protein
MKDVTRQISETVAMHFGYDITKDILPVGTYVHVRNDSQEILPELSGTILEIVKESYGTAYRLSSEPDMSIAHYCCERCDKP